MARTRNVRDFPLHLMIYDVCVVGLGGIGSAAVAECAGRGLQVIGLDQFGRGHDLGSSTGRSRMIRKAYFEDPAYVPLAHRAYELWRRLERDAGEDLLRVTGVLAVGKEDSEIVAGTGRAAREHNLVVESLDLEELRRRYPTLQLHSDEVGILEPEGGVLNPERAIAAHLAVAEKRGAVLRFNVRMTGWVQRADSVFEVTLNDEWKVEARSLILALGPWVQKILGDLGIPITIERNVQVWFKPANSQHAAGTFPSFLLDREHLPAPLYGFPDLGTGIKVAFHGGGEVTTAETLDRDIHETRDVLPLAKAMGEWMPGAIAGFLNAKVCMYSLTPDKHFVIDRHPAHQQLILCGGFSGHGFKFAPVVGEIAADLATTGETQQTVDFLSLRRFAGKSVLPPQ